MKEKFESPLKFNGIDDSNIHLRNQISFAKIDFISLVTLKFNRDQSTQTAIAFNRMLCTARVIFYRPILWFYFYCLTCMGKCQTSSTYRNQISRPDMTLIWWYLLHHSQAFTNDYRILCDTFTLYWKVWKVCDRFVLIRLGFKHKKWASRILIMASTKRSRTQSFDKISGVPKPFSIVQSYCSIF